jgi:hypothetical protein
VNIADLKIKGRALSTIHNSVLCDAFDDDDDDDGGGEGGVTMVLGNSCSG